MRLFEIDNLIEAFTPQVEGWYDIDDIRIWFNSNYGPKSAETWDNINSQLWTSLPDVKANDNLVDRYKGRDIEIVNDYLDGLFPFQCLDIQYYKGKAVWKCAPKRPSDIE